MTQPIQIDANKVYNSVEILEIVKQKNWIKSRKTLNFWIEQYQDFLKPTIQGKGNGKRYYIVGSNLINFLAKFEDGSLHEGRVRTIPVNAGNKK
jgi:hypothetical protein